jgi:hypothetical protein
MPSLFDSTIMKKTGSSYEDVKNAEHSLGDFFFGRKGGFEQTPTMNPQQQQLLQQLLGGLQGSSGQGFDFLSSLFGNTGQFEAPLMRQFNEQIIPGIAERFSGSAANPRIASAQSSSAFTQALGQAGSGLMEQLGALRGGLGMQGLGHLQGLMGQGLGAKSFESMYRPESYGLLGSVLPGLIGSIGSFGSQAGLMALAKKMGIL